MVDWGYGAEVLPQLLDAAIVTIEATVAGMALALVWGLVWTLIRRAPARLVARAADWCVDFIRSTPLLIQIYVLYYVLPDVGIRISALTCGVLALGLHYSAYTSEVYRAGIEGVPRGQWEAARALNLGQSATFVRVILPQAIPPVLPALGNYFIAMFKDTPMLSAITVLELLQTAKILGSVRFRYLEPITIVGVLFLSMSLITSWGVRRLERHVASGGVHA